MSCTDGPDHLVEVDGAAHRLSPRRRRPRAGARRRRRRGRARRARRRRRGRRPAGRGRGDEDGGGDHRAGGRAGARGASGGQRAGRGRARRWCGWSRWRPRRRRRDRRHARLRVDEVVTPAPDDRRAVAWPARGAARTSSPASTSTPEEARAPPRATTRWPTAADRRRRRRAASSAELAILPTFADLTAPHPQPPRRARRRRRVPQPPRALPHLPPLARRRPRGPARAVPAGPAAGARALRHRRPRRARPSWRRRSTGSSRPTSVRPSQCPSSSALLDVWPPGSESRARGRPPRSCATTLDRLIVATQLRLPGRRQPGPQRALPLLRPAAHRAGPRRRCSPPPARHLAHLAANPDAPDRAERIDAARRQPAAAHPAAGRPGGRRRRRRADARGADPALLQDPRRSRTSAPTAVPAASHVVTRDYVHSDRRRCTSSRPAGRWRRRVHEVAGGGRRLRRRPRPTDGPGRPRPLPGAARRGRRRRRVSAPRWPRLLDGRGFPTTVGRIAVAVCQAGGEPDAACQVSSPSAGIGTDGFEEDAVSAACTR